MPARLKEKRNQREHVDQRDDGHVALESGIGVVHPQKDCPLKTRNDAKMFAISLSPISIFCDPHIPFLDRLFSVISRFWRTNPPPDS